MPSTSSDVQDTSEQSNTSGENNGSTQPEAQQQEEFQPITSQDELNRVLGKRLEQQRRQFGDYDELKSKAEQFDQIEEANRTEVEKAANRATAAEQERDDSRADAARLRVALKHGLSESDAELLNDLRDEEAMTRLAERLAKQAQSDDPNVGFGVDHSTTQTTVAPNKDDQARSFFGI